MDKTKNYLDLSKCTEGEQRNIFKVLTENNQLLATQLHDIFYFRKYSEFNFYSLLFLNQWKTWQVTDKLHNLKELTYTDFIKLFEGGESKEVLQVDIYSGELNTERISNYKKLSEQYNIEESTVRDIFNAGADWVNKLKFK